MSDALFEAIAVTKRFGTLTALNNVDLRLHAGKVHALLGENGAGKSTLVKCIMGYYQADTGEFLLHGRQVTIANTREAHALGIGMVYQHFTLVPNMTVAENLVLARPQLPAVIDWRAEIARIEQKLQLLPFRVPLNASVNDLAAGERQKVEILKQLLLDTRILILDEPTSVLTPSEADDMLHTIKAMTHERDLSVLIITHKFREVMEYADEVTVLQRGQFTGHALVSDVTPQSLATLMVGQAMTVRATERVTPSIQEAGLSLRGIQAQGDRGTVAVDGFSIDVQRGEIVGVAGVSGNGQRELMEVLSGQRPWSQGAITVGEVPYRATRADMQRFGLHCLPEEPLRNAAVPNLSVADNLALRLFDRADYTRARWWVNRTALRRYAVDKIAQYHIKTPTPETTIASLSGGNVQRCILARELTEQARILVIANPCFGLDFQAVSDIRARLLEARNCGAAVLLISEDLDEILELSDRVVVMSQGKAVYQTTPADADLNVIGQHMAGHA